MNELKQQIEKKATRKRLFYLGIGMLIGDIIGFILFRNVAVTIGLVIVSCGVIFTSMRV